MVQIKGQVQPSHLSNLQPYRLISHLRDKGHPNTFYLPNLKQNRCKYHVSRQGSSRDQFVLLIYQFPNHIGYNLIIATRVISILSFYRIQSQIGLPHVLNRGTRSTFPFIKLCKLIG